MNYILFRTHMSTISRTFHYTTFSTTKNRQPLSLTNLITQKPSKLQISSNHLKLIQSCIQDLLQPTLSPITIREPNPNPNPNQFLHQRPISQNLSSNMFVEIPDSNACWGTLFFQMHKQGMKAEAGTLSCALSFCGLNRHLEFGVQLHCLGLKSGFDGYVYIGSCLISLYGKCGNLDEAYRVFEEMPVRNVVSWTAIIAGFAQYWRVEMCLKLYCRMRCLSMKPNEFTFTSIISACAGSGALRQGKSVHCQMVRMSFDSYVHIGNALITMYSKCGNVEEAFCIFESMQRKDLVSWNSMIAGYAQHGLAKRAIGMLKEMEKLRIKPDAITFLGVLSSCRHAGLIDQGRVIFNTMIQHGVEPDVDHYSCIVDLLGRAGLVEEAKEFIDKMPIRPNAVIWGSLLSSCRLHGEIQIGIEAAENRLSLVPDCTATYMQLVNLYANAGYWGDAARVRKMMKDKKLKTNTGYSWIEIKDEIYKFKAEDRSNARLNEILTVLDSLIDNMRRFGHSPNTHEEEFDT